MSAPKKDPSTRARANKASTASTLGNVPTIAPELPTRPAAVDENGERFYGEWAEETLEWWADLWASPMAAEYHTSDRHGLFLLAVLMDDFWKEPSTKLASEIRLQRVAFGLTPYDRRRLEWTIETAEESKDRGRARASRTGSKQPDPAADPRSVLRAVV